MEVIGAYFKALAKPNASVTTDAFNIWRTQNPTNESKYGYKITNLF